MAFIKRGAKAESSADNDKSTLDFSLDFMLEFGKSAYSM